MIHENIENGTNSEYSPDTQTLSSFIRILAYTGSVFETHRVDPTLTSKEMMVETREICYSPAVCWTSNPMSLPEWNEGGPSSTETRTNK